MFKRETAFVFWDKENSHLKKSALVRGSSVSETSVSSTTNAHKRNNSLMGINWKIWNNLIFLNCSWLKLVQHKCVSNVVVYGAKSSSVLLVHLLCRCVFAVYQEQVWCWSVELPGLALGPVQNIKNNFIDE